MADDKKDRDYRENAAFKDWEMGEDRSIAAKKAKAAAPTKSKPGARVNPFGPTILRAGRNSSMDVCSGSMLRIVPVSASVT